MATFDEKSIFGRRNETQNETDEVLNEEELEQELDDEAIEDTPTEEEIPTGEVEEEDSSLDSETRVIGEEYVESEKARKTREKNEKKAQHLEEKQYKIMLKHHRKAMEKNPENIKRYDTDIEKGLPDDVVERRVMDDLVNKTRKGSTKSKKMIVITNIFTFFNMLTLCLAIWLMTIQAWTDLFFFVIATANAIIGIYQELKAKKIIDRLSLLSAPTATVIRNGAKKEIAVGDVVLDDMIVLSSGNQVCADSVVVSGSVEVNESLLTGESDAIIKKPGDLLFSGSFIVSGNCKARVDKIGKDNYIEKLSNQARKYQKPNSELLKSLHTIIYVMSCLIIPIGLTLFFMQLGHNIEYVTAVRKSIGAMVGMIPSGLWLLTSVTLFVGVIKLSQRNVLVQELYCIEMLARINVLCLDKTGTITDGTMSVKNVIDYNSLYGMTSKNIISAMLNALNESNLTSKALEERFGLNKRIKHIATIPFSSQRKYNAVTFDKMGTFALGAPEFVLKNHFEKIKKEVDGYAGQGYRVLCLAHFNGMIEDQQLPKSDPEIMALILIEDNIRPDAIKTINYFKESGVSVRVISGDNPLTVSKISERAGIEHADDYISLDGLSDAEVERAALKYTVFGRVSPSQKKLLVTTLKNAGKKVAMTGDGVNDILALKEADCSIAIASGSEAARNVSHLVLVDSNFDSMPKIVAEGRRVINNVTSVASLFLTKTIFSLLLAIQAMTNGGAYPISTNQLIMIDLFVTGIPSFVLALEPNNKEVDGNFLLNILRGALPGAVTILIVALAIFGFSEGLELDTISTQTIIVIAATHTCLMVLFKVCKPFNTLRKTLCIACYSAFLLITMVLPQFLEFRPIFKFSEYHSDKVEHDVLRYLPQIYLSDANILVIDDEVTGVPIAAGAKLNDVKATSEFNNETNKYDFYYTISQYDTRVPVKDVAISFDTKGNIVLGGNEVYIKVYNSTDNTRSNRPITYSADFKERFTIDEKGYLYYDKNPVMRNLTETNKYYGFSNKYHDATITKEVQICIMPIVELKNNQLSITPVTYSGGSDSSSLKTYATDIKGNFELSIDVETKQLLVNGSPVGAKLSDGTISSVKYTVELPIISYDKNGNILVNGYDTPVSAEAYDLDAEKLKDLVLKNLAAKDNPSAQVDLPFKVLPSNTFYYVVDKDEQLVNSKTAYSSNVTLATIAPDITITEADHYIINGYYTEYVFDGSSRHNPRVNADNCLVLGNVVTDYKISVNNVTTVQGGIVEQFSLQAKIFLFMLCLLAVPLMNILSAVVPWFKKQIAFIRKLLSKF